MLATGKIAPEVIMQDRKELDYVLGFEYSGISTNGLRIMGVYTNR